MYVLLFFFLRYFGCRGGSEVNGLLWEQVDFRVFSKGPYEGKNYVTLNIDFDKSKCDVLCFI